jgi:hypothetical protein
MRTPVRVGPSGRGPILRTHVPPATIRNVRAARSRRPPPHPLVPAARGRLSRRLGGRSGRAFTGGPSAPSAAARASGTTTSGHARPPGTCLSLARGSCQRPIPGPSEPARRATEHDDGMRCPSVWGLPTTTIGRRGRPIAQKNRRRPTLPGPCEPSTIGAEGLNCSVRNGKRCFPLAKATGKRRETTPFRSFKTAQRHWVSKNPSSPRPISTGLLQTLPSFQIRPINLVVYQGSYSL